MLGVRAKCVISREPVQRIRDNFAAALHSAALWQKLPGIDGEQCGEQADEFAIGARHEFGCWMEVASETNINAQ